MDAKQARTEARAKYAKLMDLVDGVDREVLGVYPSFKKSCWTTSCLVWVTLIILQVNARRIYESGTGHFLGNAPNWTDTVMRTIAEVEWSLETHTRTRVGRTNCRSCYHLKACRRQTTQACRKCGGICQHCEKDDSHRQFFLDKVRKGLVRPKD